MNNLVLSVEPGDPTVVNVQGRIDTNTSPAFEHQLNQLIDDGVTHLVVDMDECSYVSSAGLRVIVGAQKKLLGNGSIVYRSVTPDVMEVFDLTGFTSILSFE